MSNKIADVKHRERRIKFMLPKHYIGKIGLLLILPLLLMVMRFEYAFAGHTAPVTDAADARLIYYWDLRDRDTFLHLTNIDTAGPAKVHVQIFDALNFLCPEFNFFDTYTPGDSHIYDMSNLTANDGSLVGPPDFSGLAGWVAITLVEFSDNSERGDDILTGALRVVDKLAAFEYRTNAAGVDDSSPETTYLFNFNTVNGSVFSDLLWVQLDHVSDPGGVFTVEPFFLEPEYFDEFENPISCPSHFVTCGFGSQDGVIPAANNFFFGVNQLIVNSRQDNNLCLGTAPIGFSETRSSENDSDVYVFFIGLNNGDGTGSMDIAFGD